MESRVISLCNRIRKFEYVSFDLFDTLVFRTFSDYTYVFDYVQNIYNKNKDKQLSNFPQKRRYAEQLARRFASTEVTLDDIYCNIPYENKIIQELKTIEEQVEIMNCTPNDIMIKVLSWCRCKEKKIIITTDMYLSRDVIIKILNKFNITYDFVFLSCEERATKRNGQLFDVVLNKLNINKTQISHIGDNELSDITNARNHGIEAFLRLYNNIKFGCSSNFRLTNKLRKIEDRFGVSLYPLTKLDFNEDHIKTLLKNKANREHIVTSCLNVGYGVIGPMLYDFCLWIHKKKIENNLQVLLFVAREGYLIKKCYEILYPDEKGNLMYVYLNKNVLRYPLIECGDKINNFILTLPSRCKTSWKEIFSILRLSEEDIINIINKFPDINLETSIFRVSLNTKKNRDILEYIFLLQEKIIKEQDMLFFEYISNCKILNCKVGLVNNSIRGNGQYLIETYLSNKGYSSNIFGLQIYADKECFEKLGDRFAVWTSDIKIKNKIIEEDKKKSLLLEHLLFKSSGTSICLKNQDNNVIAICNQMGKEKNNYGYVLKLQKYALDFIRDIKQNIWSEELNLGYKLYSDFLRHPSKEDAVSICNLWDDDENGEKVITDIKIPFNYKLLLRKHPSIMWVHGYLSATDKGKLFYYIFNSFNFLRRLYHRNNSSVL